MPPPLPYRPLDSTSIPASRQDVGRLGMALFRRLGVTAAVAPVAPSLLSDLLPAVQGKSYPSALRSVFTDEHGRALAASELDEARWLVDHLHLEVLGQLTPESHLARIWAAACEQAGVTPQSARVDQAALLQEMTCLAYGPDGDDLLIDGLSAAIRAAG